MARKKANDDIRRETRNFSEEQSEKAIAGGFDAQQRANAFEAQRQERVIAHNHQINDLIQAGQRRRAEIMKQEQEKLSVLRQGHAAMLGMERQAMAARMQMMAQSVRASQSFASQSRPGARTTNRSYSNTYNVSGTKSPEATARAIQQMQQKQNSLEARQDAVDSAFSPY